MSNYGGRWTRVISVVSLFLLLAASSAAFAEKEATCILFRRALDSPPLPETVPAEEEAAIFRFRLPVGEAEAVNFGIHARREIKGLTVEPKNIHMGWRDRDQVAVSVKLMEYSEFEKEEEKRKEKHWVSQLKPAEKIDLAAGTTQGYTLIVEVPLEGPPGTYEGELLIKSGEETLGEPVKLVVEVLPLRMKEPAVSWGMFYYGPLRKTKTEHDEEVIAQATVESLAQAKDMRRHGLNTFCIYSGLDADNEVYIRTKRGHDVNLEYLNRYMEVYKSAGFTGPVPYWNSRPVYTEKNAWYPNNWLKFTERDMQKCHRIVEAIVKERIKRDWPEVLFYLIDEPGQIGRARLAARIFEDVHFIPGARTFTCLRPELTHVFGEHLDVACFHTDRADWERIKSLRLIYPFEVWRYIPFKKSSSAKSIRWAAGLRPWLREEQGALFYRYERSGVDVENGLSTLAWEGLREGINDFRYLHTLQVLIEKGYQIEDDEDAAAVASEAETFIKSLKESVVPDAETDKKSPWEWEKFEEIRDTARDYIVRLVPHMKEARFRTFDEELGHRRDDMKWEDWIKEHGEDKRIIEF